MTMTKKRTFGEIFEHMATLSKTVDKVAWLRLHDSLPLRYFLGLALANTEWLLPEGAPPFKPDGAPLGYSPSHLNRELRAMYLFLKGGGADNLDAYRREKRFQQILESLHSSEVDLLLAVKDKKFASKYKCTKAVVETAFPGLLNDTFPIRFIR